MKLNYISHRISNLININKIVTVHYYELDKHFNFEGEIHDFWEMVYIDKGQVYIKTKAKEVCVRQGEVIFHKPNEFHTLRADGDTAPNVFVISFVSSSKIMSFFKYKHVKVPAEIKKYMFSLINEAENTFHSLPVKGTQLSVKEDAPYGGQQMLKTYLEQFLIMLIRKEQQLANPQVFPTKESMENHLVLQIMQLIEANVNEKLSIEDICRKLKYSKTYLSKIFKAATGYTMVHYINELKIKKAKKLIREENHNFSQISDLLAFENPHYFSRVFKRITSMSPSEYRSSVKSMTEE